jgi:uncharacterized protein (DUF488 family)
MAMPSDQTRTPTLYTIGHSRHPAEAFLALLRLHGIARVLDVRSRPVSRWPQFGRERLARLLEEAGLGYRWLGEALGGRPADPRLYGPDGAPDDAAMAAAPAFREGLAALRVELTGALRVAVLCSEGDPRRCHREHLIARALRPLGVRVRHILPDGTLADDERETGPAAGPLELEV